MPSLADRTRTLDANLQAMLREGGAFVASRLGGNTHFVALQLAESGSDLVAAGRALAQAHRGAIRVFRNQESSGRPIPANRGEATLLSQPTELATLSVLFKAWLFFVRAFCDHAYRLLLADAENRPAPRSGSMKSILNPLNPVAVIFDARAPEITEWFRAHRELRNAMKEGAAFAFSGLDARGLALTIYEIRTRKEPDREIEVLEGPTIRFADVVEDSNRMVEILALLAEGTGTREPRSRHT